MYRHAMELAQTAARPSFLLWPVGVFHSPTNAKKSNENRRLRPKLSSSLDFLFSSIDARREFGQEGMVRSRENILSYRLEYPVVNQSSGVVLEIVETSPMIGVAVHASKWPTRKLYMSIYVQFPAQFIVDVVLAETYNSIETVERASSEEVKNAFA